MAKPKRYGRLRGVSLSDEVDAKLVAAATQLGVKPAVLARMFIEQALDDKNFTGAK